MRCNWRLHSTDTPYPRSSVLLIDVVLTSNAIGWGPAPIFAATIDRKKLVQLPITYRGDISEYSLARYRISSAIKILRQALIKTVADMDDGM